MADVDRGLLRELEKKIDSFLQARYEPSSPERTIWFKTNEFKVEAIRECIYNIYTGRGWSVEMVGDIMAFTKEAA